MPLYGYWIAYTMVVGAVDMDNELSLLRLGKHAPESS
jgi:hypothetical protein